MKGISIVQWATVDAENTSPGDKDVESTRLESKFIWDERKPCVTIVISSP